MRERFFNPDEAPYKQFAQLRRQIHQIIKIEVARRLRNNPEPTEEEIYIGAFREMIEPQVRDAVFKFYRKGYATESSGFGGKNGEIQSLDGYFEIDKETKRKMEALGAQVLKGKDIGLPGLSKRYTHIQFKPKTANINEIQKEWDTIAEVLPSKNKAAPPSISGGSEDFLRSYASARVDIEKKMLKRRLVLEKFSPEAEQKMIQRLNELSDEG